MSHWDLTEIDLFGWAINIYDFNQSVVIDKQIHEVFEKMEQLIPHLMLCSSDFLKHPKVIDGPYFIFKRIKMDIDP